MAKIAEMNVLSKLKISYKLALLSVLSGSIFIVYLFFSLLVNFENEENFRLIEKVHYPVLEIVNQGWLDLSAMDEMFAEAILEEDSMYLLEAEKKASDVVSGLEKIIILSPAMNDEVTSLIKTFNHYFKTASTVAILMIDGTLSEETANKQLGVMHAGYAVFKDQLESFRINTEMSFTERLRQSRENSVYASQLGVFLGVLLIILLSVFSIVITKSITKPLNKMIDYARRITDGDFDVVIDPALSTPNDELSELNHALSYMQVSVRESINDLTVARNDAIKAQQVKGEFLANMSHEIRTPMNAIIGLSYLCLETRLTDKQAEYVSNIYDSSNQLLGIINDILDVTKIESGKMELESIPFEFDKVVKNLATTFALKADQQDVAFLIDVSPDIPQRLIGDQLRLSQILINLVGNAFKFTNAGEIVVVAEKISETESAVCLQLSVEDTGIGITHAQLDGLFRPFSQADSSTTRKYGGTGLGLTISKQLVEMMGGGIKVDTEAGKGAKFTFTANFEKVSGQQARPEQWVDEINAGQNILLITDRMHSRKLLDMYLSNAGFNVSVILETDDVLEFISDELDAGRSYELLLFEFEMDSTPDKQIESTETLAQSIKALNAESAPAILFLSTPTRCALMEKMKSTVIDGTLPLPFLQADLIGAVMPLLGSEVTNNVQQQRGDRPSLSMDLKDSRILLAEDNVVNQMVAKGMLENMGIVVSIAENGQEALALLEAGAFDAVLMDMQMPVMGGVSATREIRKQSKYDDLPVIAMTANAMDHDREACFSAGMNDFLSKPIDIEHLHAVLLHWIDPGSDSDEKVAVAAPVIDEKRSLSSAESEIGDDEKMSAFIDLLGIDVVRPILEHVPDTLREYIVALNAAVSESNADEVLAISHKIKGSAGNLYALRLSQLASDIQDGAEDLHSIRDMLLKIESVAEDTITWWKSKTG